MERRKRTYIIGLLAFVLVLTGVYALLAANLSIAGTATGVADFKVEFLNFTISNEEKATATLNANNTSLNIEADLRFPGDQVIIDFTIKNTGSLSATVEDLVINNNDNEDITITINGINTIKGTNLNVAETTTGSIIITWNTMSTNPEPEIVNFDVSIDYIQTV